VLDTEKPKKRGKGGREEYKEKQIKVARRGTVGFVTEGCGHRKKEVKPREPGERQSKEN